MLNLTTRSGKGSPLTIVEHDQNLTDIQTLANALETEQLVQRGEIDANIADIGSLQTDVATALGYDARLLVVEAHVNSTGNPHGVTNAQVNLAQFKDNGLSGELKYDTLNVKLATAIDGIDITGDLRVTGAMSSGALSISTLTASGLLSAQAGLDVTGDIDLTGDLNLNSISLVDDAGALKVYSGVNLLGTIEADKDYLSEGHVHAKLNMYARGGQVVLGTSALDSPKIVGNGDLLELYNGQNEKVSVADLAQNFQAEGHLRAKAGGVYFGTGNARATLSTDDVIIYNGQNEKAGTFDQWQNIIAEGSLYARGGGVVVGGSTSNSPYLWNNAGALDLYNGETELVATFGTNQQLTLAGGIYLSNGGAVVFGSSAGADPYIAPSVDDLLFYPGGAAGETLRLSSSKQATFKGVVKAEDYLWTLDNAYVEGGILALGSNYSTNPSIRKSGTALQLYNGDGNRFAYSSGTTLLVDGSVYSKGNNFVLGSTSTQVKLTRSSLGAIDFYTYTGTVQNKSMSIHADAPANALEVRSDGVYLEGLKLNPTGSTRLVENAGNTEIKDEAVVVAEFDYNTLTVNPDNNSVGTLKVTGGGTGATNAEFLAVATQSSNYRGIGMCLYDTGGDTEWFAGRPYANSDRFVVSRASGNLGHDGDVANMGHANTVEYLRMEGDNGLYVYNSSGKYMRQLPGSTYAGLYTNSTYWYMNAELRAKNRVTIYDDTNVYMDTNGFHCDGSGNYIHANSWPVFCSRPTSGFGNHYASGATMYSNQWGTTWTDDWDNGSNFSNGIFTAPVQGWYQFNAGVAVTNYSNDEYWRVGFYGNYLGTKYCGGFMLSYGAASQSNEYTGGVWSQARKCDAGEQIRAFFITKHHSATADFNNRAHFSGHLIVAE